MNASTVVYLMIACLAVGALGGFLAGDLAATSRWDRTRQTGQHSPDRAPGATGQTITGLGEWPEPLSPRLTDRFTHEPVQYGTLAEHARREEIRLRPAAQPERELVDEPEGAPYRPLALVAAMTLSAVDSVERGLMVGRFRQPTYPWTRPDPEVERFTWLADTGQLPGLMEDSWKRSNPAA